MREKVGKNEGSLKKINSSKNGTVFIEWIVRSY